LIKKRHEPCLLFLEDVFSESHKLRLLEAGFARVERFVDHFRDSRTRKAAQSVKDTPIIKLCDDEGWLLVTPDKDMQFTHVEQIKTTEIAILATAHNNAPDFGEWVEALILGKATIERYFKKCARPCFATINRQGNLTIPRVFTPDCSTRRNRPKEITPSETTSHTAAS